jgi:hypothetical protein
MKAYSIEQVIAMFSTMTWVQMLAYVEQQIQWLTRVRDFLAVKIAAYKEFDVVATPEDALTRYGAELQTMIAEQPDTDDYATAPTE